VKVDLPQAANIPNQTKPDTSTSQSDAEGKSSGTRRCCPRRMLCSSASSRSGTRPQPEVHVRGDRNNAYEHIGRVHRDLPARGIQKVGFITRPDRALAR